MKPYGKTYRASKVHNAADCGLCKEDVEGGATYERQQAKREIEQGELECEDHLQWSFELGEIGYD